MPSTDEIAECYTTHANSLLRFAVSLVGSTDGPDVLATAVVAVLESRTDRIDNVRSYLYRSVHTAALKHWRTNSRRRQREQAFWTPTVVRLDEVDTGIAEQLAALSPRQRAVVHLAYWEDLTNQQIASRLGISIGTVKRHRARAQQKLSEVLHAHRQ